MAHRYGQVHFQLAFDSAASIISAILHYWCNASALATVPVVSEEWQLLCKLLHFSSFHGIPWGFVDDNCPTWDMAIKTVVCTCTGLMMVLTRIAKEVNGNAHISFYDSILATRRLRVHVFVRICLSLICVILFVQLNCSDRVVLCVVTRGLYFIICTVQLSGSLSPLLCARAAYLFIVVMFCFVRC